MSEKQFSICIGVLFLCLFKESSYKI